MKRNISGRICLVVLCGILAAGLWPFNPFPPNDVHWLASEDGLLFGRKNGLLISSGPLKTQTSPEAQQRSLEVWLEPNSESGAGTFLSFYGPENTNWLGFRQWTHGLLLRHAARDQHGHLNLAEIGVDHVFRRRKQVFITVTCGAEGTAFYVDGTLLSTATPISVSAKEFSGDIVVGTSPVNRSGWAGWMRGLAIYDQELTSKQVFKHYKIWTENGPVETLEREAVALYKFNERAGTVAHNRGTDGPDLEIPASFKVPYGRTLEMGWESFEYSRSYLRDVVLNIIGFIPLGLFFRAYWGSTRRNLCAILGTVLLGGLISLTIEILQKYIPVRDSDMTDVITNTLGTAIGAIWFQWKMTHALLMRLELVITQPKYRFWKSPTV